MLLNSGGRIEIQAVILSISGNNPSNVPYTILDARF